MNISRRQPMTVDEFLAWERRQELRDEFDGCEPVAMTGGTLNHAAIATNLVANLQEQSSARMPGLSWRRQDPYGRPGALSRCGGNRLANGWPVRHPAQPGRRL
jgi:hypothetical protein